MLLNVHSVHTVYLCAFYAVLKIRKGNFSKELWFSFAMEAKRVLCRCELNLNIFIKQMVWYKLYIQRDALFLKNPNNDKFTSITGLLNFSHSLLFQMEHIFPDIRCLHLAVKMSSRTELVYSFRKNCIFRIFVLSSEFWTTHKIQMPSNINRTE